MPASLKRSGSCVNNEAVPDAELRARLCGWFDSPLGRSVQALEANHLREVLPQLYGATALQLGCIGKLDLLDASAAPARVLLDVNGAPIARPTDASVEAALAGVRTSLVRAQFDAIPLDSRSIDVALLPHTLDFSDDPHRVLREVSRVLSPEGHVVILGFNLVSLWGLRRLLARRPRVVPWCGNFFRLARIRDWLKLLDFEFTHGGMLYYRPPVQREHVIDRLYFLEKAGDRWWPMMAAVYLLVAKKRVLGMTPLPLTWKRTAAGPVVTESAVRTALRRWHSRVRRYG